ncbi:unnamed protein product [Brassica rapa subsp. trilocularis]
MLPKFPTVHVHLHPQDICCFQIFILKYIANRKRNFVGDVSLSSVPSLEFYTEERESLGFVCRILSGLIFPFSSGCCFWEEGASLVLLRRLMISGRRWLLQHRHRRLCLWISECVRQFALFEPYGEFYQFVWC